MAKNKQQRSLKNVRNAQKKIELDNMNKFADAERLITQNPQPSLGRISPQITCTISPDDKQLLNELTIYAVNKTGKLVNTSSIVRALIRIGIKRKEELEF